MVLAARNGFQLSGHLNGTVAPAAHRYQKATDHGQDSVIYIGDPVVLTSAGQVNRVNANSSTAGGRASNHWFLGVCTGIYETEQGRPLTHRTRKYAATADAYWVDVIDDPDAVWEVSYNGSANQTQIGTLAYVAYSSANTAAGISGAGLDYLEPAATAVSSPFRVVGIVNLNLDGQTNDTTGRVRIISAEHVFRSVTTV